jgi:molecular chaperone DnaJ
VKIPAGVDDGSQMRLTGEGEMGVYGGARGNLYIVFEVPEHPLFQRDGDNIIFDLNLNFAQAALGEEVQIPTLDGDQRRRCRPIQSDHLFAQAAGCPSREAAAET